MRVLGVDFGGKRIGLAVGESGMKIATPRPNLPASGVLARDAEAIAAFCRRERIEAVVVGVPEMEGSRLAGVCRQLAAQIGAQGLATYTVDEAFTSFDAETTMREAGLKGSARRKAKDGEAACRILERWWDGQA